MMMVIGEFYGKGGWNYGGYGVGRAAPIVGVQELLPIIIQGLFFAFFHFHSFESMSASTIDSWGGAGSTWKRLVLRMGEQFNR